MSMTAYTAQLSNVPNLTEFEQSIAFGIVVLNFKFQWSEEVQEQIDAYDRALDARAKADPWLDEQGNIYRDYDWLQLYTSIPHLTTTQVSDWLDEYARIPQSLAELKDTPDLLAAEVLQRCQEADLLVDRLELLREDLVWHVEITEGENDSVSRVVRTGGWLNSQNSRWQVQFESEKAEIAREDLLLVTINAEIDENA